MSSVIRLLDSSGTNVLDSVSTDYEDSFCLETFGDLVQAHRSADPTGTKEFIIARVQTWDHKQPEKAFYSYYSAYQLNKILIKTQRYKGKRLIHRLHVLNPLTNTDIIGNVQYFRVMPEANPTTESAEEPSKANDDAQPAPDILATALASDLTPNVNVTASTPTDSSCRPPEAITAPAKKHRPNLAVITTPARESVLNRSLELVPPSPSVRQVESGTTSSWTMSAPSAIEAADEEDPLLGDTANRSGGQAERSRKRSIFAGIMTPRGKTTAPSPPSQNDPSHNIEKPPMENGTHRGSNSTLARRYSASDITRTAPPSFPNIAQPSHQPPMSAYPSTTAPSNSLFSTTPIPTVPVPRGKITRFAVPVPFAELPSVLPPTAKNRRRTLSYHNAVSTSGMHASFEDWIQMVREEKREFDKERRLQNQSEGGAPRSPAGAEYDIVRPFGSGRIGSAGKRGSNLRISTPVRGAPAGLDTIVGSPPTTPDSQNGVSISVKEETESAKTSDPGHDSMQNGSTADSDIDIYDAVLFATDIDFLENSKVRQLFRENAVSPEEAKLFELPAIPADSETTPTVRSPPIVEDEECNFCWCC